MLIVVCPQEHRHALPVEYDCAPAYLDRTYMHSVSRVGLVIRSLLLFKVLEANFPYFPVEAYDGGPIITYDGIS